MDMILCRRTSARPHIVALVALAPLALITASACRTSGGGGSAPQTVAGESDGTGESGTYADEYKVVVRDSFEPDTEASSPDISVCSFNISFVGHWLAKEKQSADIAKLLDPCDVVVVQELVAPPLNFGVDADGNSYEWLDQADANAKEKKARPRETVEDFTPWWKDTTKPEAVVEEWEQDYQARHFVGTMLEKGFKYEISQGDSGRTVNHSNTTSSEWLIAFYNPRRLSFVPQTEGPGGWIRESADEPLAKNKIFDRVPYAFTFRSKPRANGDVVDFTLIPVHLHATQDRDNETEHHAAIIRAKELLKIRAWADKMKRKFKERDFIVLGDTNLTNKAQVEQVVAIAGTKDDESAAVLIDPEASETKVEKAMKAILKAFEDDPKTDFASLNSSCFPTNTSAIDPKCFDHVIFNKRASKEIVFSERLGGDLVLVDIIKKYKAEERFGGNSRAFVKAYSDHHPIMFTIRPGQDDD